MIEIAKQKLSECRYKSSVNGAITQWAGAIESYYDDMQAQMQSFKQPHNDTNNNNNNNNNNNKNNNSNDNLAITKSNSKHSNANNNINNPNNNQKNSNNSAGSGQNQSKNATSQQAAQQARAMASGLDGKSVHDAKVQSLLFSNPHGNTNDKNDGNNGSGGKNSNSASGRSGSNKTNGNNNNKQQSGNGTQDGKSGVEMDIPQDENYWKEPVQDIYKRIEMLLNRNKCEEAIELCEMVIRAADPNFLKLIEIGVEGGLKSYYQTCKAEERKRKRIHNIWELMEWSENCQVWKKKKKLEQEHAHIQAQVQLLRNEQQRLAQQASEAQKAQLEHMRDHLQQQQQQQQIAKKQKRLRKGLKIEYGGSNMSDGSQTSSSGGWVTYCSDSNSEYEKKEFVSSNGPKRKNRKRPASAMMNNNDTNINNNTNSNTKHKPNSSNQVSVTVNEKTAKPKTSFDASTNGGNGNSTDNHGEPKRTEEVKFDFPNGTESHVNKTDGKMKQANNNREMESESEESIDPRQMRSMSDKEFMFKMQQALEGVTRHNDLGLKARTEQQQQLEQRLEQNENENSVKKDGNETNINILGIKDDIVEEMKDHSDRYRKNSDGSGKHSETSEKSDFDVATSHEQDRERERERERLRNRRNSDDSHKTAPSENSDKSDHPDDPSPIVRHSNNNSDEDTKLDSVSPDAMAAQCLYFSFLFFLFFFIWFLQFV